MAVTDLGQVNGMAWARSAGSCFTSSPLAELQEWQGGKKAPVPVSLEATTGESWKRSYGRGEKLSLDGLTLTITYDDGSKKSYQKPFNEDEWSFSPREGTEIYRSIMMSCEWKKEDYSLKTQIYINGTEFAGITVEGPTRKLYAIGERLSLDGLVVNARWRQNGKPDFLAPVPEKLGAITDGYTMALGNTQFTSETIPPALTEAGSSGLYISYMGDEVGENIRWLAPNPAITKIALQNNESFSPAWRSDPEPPHSPEIPLIDLPIVDATLENGEHRGWLNINSLIILSMPRNIFIESRYDDLEKTIVVTADIYDDTSRIFIKGIVEGHKINAYRYLYGTTQATASPVSDWLSITPPSN